MKDSDGKVKRKYVYVLILVGMFLTAILTSAISFSIYRTNLSYWSESAYDYEQRIEEYQYRIQNFATALSNAGFGFYYILKAKDSETQMNPADVFGIYSISQSNRNNLINEFGKNSTEETEYIPETEDYADAGEIYASARSSTEAAVSESGYNRINSSIEAAYGYFLEAMNSYNMHFYAVCGSKYYSDTELSLEDVLAYVDGDGGTFFMKSEFDARGNMRVVQMDSNYPAEAWYPSFNDSYIKQDITNNLSSSVNFMDRMTVYVFSDDRYIYEEVDSYMYQNVQASISNHIFTYCFLIEGLIVAVLVIIVAWILMGIQKMNLRDGFLTRIPLLGSIAAACLAVTYLPAMDEWIYSNNHFIIQIPYMFAAEILVFIAAASITSVVWMGPLKYLRERTVVLTGGKWLWSWFKRWGRKTFDQALYLVDEGKKKRTWLKIVLVNAVVMAFFTCLWFFGLVGIFIYSVVLFIVGIHFLNKMQMNLKVVQKAAEDMVEGNLTADMSGDAGMFEPIKESLAKVREGVKIAVEEEVKSQKMKTELITNVSHDLKTPLTAIITYTNLLKDEHLTEEDRKEYVDILDRKSQRLKKLIEDLFEISKANSGNIQVNKTYLDVANLVRQAVFENEDKLKAANIETRLSLPAGKVMIELDGQKMYRVMDNILGNIAKYSVPGTRAYISLDEKPGLIVLTAKNISASELPEDVETLTERFVRGDASRHTEGSGLGLAIVRSFVEIQGGSVRLSVDGDLFKIVISFKHTVKTVTEAMAMMQANDAQKNI